MKLHKYLRKYFNTHIRLNLLINKEMNTIDRIKRLRDNNPDFAKVLEKEFPEIIDKEPYVVNGTLFMISNTCYKIFNS